MATSTDKTAAAATAAAANPLVEVDTKKSEDPAPPNSAKLDPANVSAPSDEESAADASQKDGKGSKTTVATVGTVSGDTSAEVTDVQKKMRRAERFGMPVQLSEQEKRNSRAERFGTAPMSDGSEASKKSEELKRKARAERFGLPVPSEPADEEAKKKARRARFATSSKPDSQEEEKRKARAIRFSNSPASSLSQVNGKGNIESKAAIAGKAGGGL